MPSERSSRSESKRNNTSTQSTPEGVVVSVDPLMNQSNSSTMLDNKELSVPAGWTAYSGGAVSLRDVHAVVRGGQPNQILLYKTGIADPIVLYSKVVLDDQHIILSALFDWVKESESSDYEDYDEDEEGEEEEDDEEEEPEPVARKRSGGDKSSK